VEFPAYGIGFGIVRIKRQRPVQIGQGEIVILQEVITVATAGVYAGRLGPQVDGPAVIVGGEGVVLQRIMRITPPGVSIGEGIIQANGLVLVRQSQVNCIHITI
jgi:hypothetical protein